MMTATAYPHIEQDERGRLFVKGTQFKVLVLLRDHVAWNWGPIQMHRQHPGLSLGQAHGLLAYYYDHKDEIDRKLAELDAQAEAFEAVNPPSPVVERLRKFKRERGVLKDSIEELSRDEKLVLLLYYFEGLNVGEVAKALQATQDEVRSTLERVLKLFRERLHQADEVRSVP